MNLIFSSRRIKSMQRLRAILNIQVLKDAFLELGRVDEQEKNCGLLLLLAQRHLAPGL